MTRAVPQSDLADTVMERLTAVYPTGADATRAAGAAAYMKGVAPFLGLYTPDRRALSRTVVEGMPRPDEADCTAIALRCWELPEREYHYFAVDYLRRHVGRCSSGFRSSAGSSSPSPGGTPSTRSPRTSSARW